MDIKYDQLNSDQVELLCDRCRQSFFGKEWMAESKGEILCNDCYFDSREEL